MVSFEDFILSEDRPIYLQIIRHIKQKIAAGAIADQEEVPSRRALSALLGVNPNTIQKAYHILEEEGVIVSRSGAMSYAHVDAAAVERIRRELLAEDTKAWVTAMRRLEISREEAFALAEDIWEAGREGRI